jgi:signal transduction histidine kinase
MQRTVSSIRSVLGGFAGLLILMGGLAVDAGLQTRHVSAMSTKLRKDSLDRDSLLDQLLTDTYRSSTLVRDYILEPDEALAAEHKAELQRLRSRSEQEFRSYSRNAPKNESEPLSRLWVRYDSYWSSLSPALEWDRSARIERREAFIRTTLIPARNEIVKFGKEVTALDEKVLEDAEAQIQTVQARFQRRVTAISIFTLIFGAVLAFVVVRHARRLGIEAANRFDEVLVAREDLRRLSDRLVAVQEEERRSLSRELHDDLGQSMSAMLIELGKLESTRTNPENIKDGLASVRRLAEENVGKVRNMALLLRPGMLDELGLVPALRWHAKEVTRRTGLKVKMIADELDDDLPDATRTCIYRVVQEALNNSVKHSKATEVRVVIQRGPDGLSISVQDDGVGFDPAHNKGLGLLGMIERVGGIGGRFHIESQPGGGTTLSTFFPLESDRCKPEQESVV